MQTSDDITAALILGAAVWEDGPSPTLRRRTGHAASLFHARRVSHLVPCGGLGNHPPSEGEAMRQLLVAAGVPETAIHPETASRDTLENIRNARPILDRIGARRVVIVTDAPASAPRAHGGAQARSRRARQRPARRRASGGADPHGPARNSGLRLLPVAVAAAPGTP
ncbi:YdcF family protein [Limimaricola hongkongensis]|uniref:DUF218 domain-containing protein n=1 Tax=Limimaricola hongkongensis DSM 17492 TaxID=1122180 RepID=A0A017HD22_9RHOB|nr:hypothetical protein Lokhon_00997 [Limimaricola hongkongensis DSM 17492]